MALQFSTTVRDAMNETLESTINTFPHLKIRTGSAPANCAAADTGTVLADAALPSDWLGASSGGVKAKAGTWQDTSADASGDAGHFRIYASGGACHMQGTVTATGGGGDMTVDNITFASGQTFTVTSFTITAGNA